MSDRRDLSGVWYGRYSASNYQEENSFIALIEEALGVLDGSVSEPDEGAASIRRASLTGLREARSSASSSNMTGAAGSRMRCATKGK